MSHRLRKWEKKTDPDTVGARLKQTRDLAVEKQGTWQPRLHDLNMRVKELLGPLGIPAHQQHYYISAAQDFWKLRNAGVPGPVSSEVDGLTAKWTGRDLVFGTLSQVAGLLGYSPRPLILEEDCPGVPEPHAPSHDVGGSDPITHDYVRWLGNLKGKLAPGFGASTPVVNRLYLGATENPQTSLIDYLSWIYGAPYSGNVYVVLYADNGETPAGGARLFQAGPLIGAALYLNSSAIAPPISVARGLLWFGIVFDTTTANALERMGVVGFPYPGAPSMLSGCRTDIAWGAPPDPCPAVILDPNTSPLFGIRRVV